MANPDRLTKINEGVAEWNRWRIDHPNDYVDLRDADLSGKDLSRANFYGADLAGAILTGSTLYLTTLRHANLKGADLSKANLECAHMVDTDVEQAIFTGCKVYGLSAWDLKGKPKDQTGLIVTSRHEPNSTKWDEPEIFITVDDLQTAQFIHLLLKNENVRNIINAVTSKAVLILGNFKKKRKAVLDAIREELRKFNLTPIIFDFDPSANQDITDTVTLLARMARFVIADLTDPRSVQQELTLIAPEVLVAIQPIILQGQQPWSMFNGLSRRSQGMLPIHEYTDLDDLLLGLKTNVLEPVEAKRKELLLQHH